MAEHYPQGHESETAANDRGLFDFGKKEDKEKEHVNMAEAEHKPSLMEKLHRSNSSSSSSSEEEVEEDGVKIRRKKKKGLTEKIKEKLPGHKDEGVAAVPGGYDHHQQQAPVPEEKKGFMEKIKEKIPGQQKDEYPVAPAPVPAPAPAPAHYGGGGYSEGAVEGTHEPPKKGILEKIKDKLPGGGHKEGDDAKDHY